MYLVFREGSGKIMIFVEQLNLVIILNWKPYFAWISELSLLKSTNLVLNFYAELRTFPVFQYSRLPGYLKTY